MKAIKIGLAIVVIGTIAFFVLHSSGTTNKMEEVLTPKNAFVERIQNEIDSIKIQPNSKFNKSIYNDIKYLIDDHYKPHPPRYPVGRLGDTQWENDQQKKNLSRNLYSAYANKFLEQAFYIFENKEWSSPDLAYIRSEYQVLQKSTYLEGGNSLDIKFGEIKRIFDKYDQVNNFISTCNGFSFPKPSSSLSTEDYNYIEPIRGLLDQINTYRQNLLSNTYLRNCTRLQTNVNSVPQSLFQKHVQYLDERITQWSGLYTEVNTQIMYRNTLYDPLNAEIAEVNSDLYGNTISTTDDERRRLLTRWNEDASLAYTHIEKKQKNIKNDDN